MERCEFTRRTLESLHSLRIYRLYLRQVNHVNDGDTVFMALCVSLCLCARALQTGPTGQSDSWGVKHL